LEACKFAALVMQCFKLPLVGVCDCAESESGWPSTPPSTPPHSGAGVHP